MQMNRIEIAGFLASRPETRYLPSGTKVANARLGESHRFKVRTIRPSPRRTGTALLSTTLWPTRC
jgi:single-stranded DNA-binding protein